MNFLNIFALTAFVWTVTACQTTVEKLPEPEHPHGMAQVDWDSVSGLRDDGDMESFRKVLENNLAWVVKQKPERVFNIGTRSYTAGDLSIALLRVQADLSSGVEVEKLNEILSRYFDLYAEPGAPVKATGYYVPLIEGSLKQEGDYRIPVQGVPDDLVTVKLSDFSDEWGQKSLRGRVLGKRLVPYFTREELRSKPSEGMRPIAWVKDEFGLFVVEIQGSGILRTPDGEEQIIGYAEQNGQPYKAVGTLLLRENKISKAKMSMKAIRDYVTAHPEELNHVMNYNPSVVFFQFGKKAVVGNMNVPLTPGRSVATDQKVYPPGLPMLLRVEKPAMNEAGEVISSGLIQRFVINQDVGGAIKGPARVDFFWGAGVEAEAMASVMQHEGTVYALVPKK